MEALLTGDVAKDLGIIEGWLSLFSRRGTGVTNSKFFEQRISLANACEKYEPSSKFFGRTIVMQPIPFEGESGGTVLSDNTDVTEVRMNFTPNQA